MGSDSADELLAKIRRFVHGLDADERAMFAALLAPGVALAHGEPEVSGFGDIDVGWVPDALPTALRDALLREHVYVVGLGDDR